MNHVLQPYGFVAQPRRQMTKNRVGTVSAGLESAVIRLGCFNRFALKSVQQDIRKQWCSDVDKTCPTTFVGVPFGARLEEGSGMAWLKPWGRFRDFHAGVISLLCAGAIISFDHLNNSVGSPSTPGTTLFSSLLVVFEGNYKALKHHCATTDITAGHLLAVCAIQEGKKNASWDLHWR